MTEPDQANIEPNIAIAGQMPAGDWDLLFAAVLCRMGALLDAATSDDATLNTLRDCVAELDLLRAAITPDRMAPSCTCTGSS